MQNCTGKKNEMLKVYGKKLCFDVNLIHQHYTISRLKIFQLNHELHNKVLKNSFCSFH